MEDDQTKPDFKAVVAAARAASEDEARRMLARLKRDRAEGDPSGVDPEPPMRPCRS